MESSVFRVIVAVTILGLQVGCGQGESRGSGTGSSGADGSCSGPATGGGSASGAGPGSGGMEPAFPCPAQPPAAGDACCAEGTLCGYDPASLDPASDALTGLLCRE